MTTTNALLIIMFSLLPVLSLVIFHFETEKALLFTTIVSLLGVLIISFGHLL